MDVMRSFSIPAAPLPVEALALNPQMFERVKEHGWPKNGAQTEQWHREDGSWIVGVGGVAGKPDADDYVSTRGPGWHGHLIVLIDDRFGIDVTVDQLATKRMKWPALEKARGLAFEVTQEFMDGSWLHCGVQGGVVQYRREPQNIEYRKMRDWRLAARRRPSVKSLTRDVRARFTWELYNG
jgi:hypothetical protein